MLARYQIPGVFFDGPRASLLLPQAVPARLLRLAGWPAERLRLALVEPVEAVRREAVARVASFTSSRVDESARLPDGLASCFEVVVANHCLYYVADLRGEFARLIDSLSAPGAMFPAIAGRRVGD